MSAIITPTKSKKKGIAGTLEVIKAILISAGVTVAGTLGLKWIKSKIPDPTPLKQGAVDIAAIVIGSGIAAGVKNNLAKAGGAGLATSGAISGISTIVEKVQGKLTPAVVGEAPIEGAIPVGEDLGWT